MKSGGGGGGAAVDLGVDGLVALPVLQLLLNVGGEGHFPQSVQHLQKNALVLEMHQPVAAGQLLGDLGGELPISEGDTGAGAQLLTGPHQTFPRVLTPVNEQQDLTGSAAGEPMTQQPGRENTGVIEDQTVAGPQIVRQIVEVAMHPCAGILIQHQQAGGIPPGDGGLGDKLLGEFKIKITGFHRK